ncbi:trithorax group protein osa isoform X4 [Periplaneta americana]|uniref:trithorax group protein osa isoform X4 n=1 Tax=Periplaneta americana TaxID=6978 RepID=UPI0037E7A32A
MAATQAESQQNEVNREQVQQDQPPDLSNTVLQNGTEKNGGRGIVGSDSIVNTKTKSPGQNSLAVEMSQYRQESGAGPPIHNSSGNSDQNTNNSGVDSSKLNSDGKSFVQNSEQSAGSEQNYGKGSDSGQNMQGFGLGFTARGNYHPDQHGAGNPVQNSADSSNLHQNHPFSQFSAQNMRHGFPSSKPMPGSPMVPPRPPSTGPNMNVPSGGFSAHTQPQRFLSGQTISQPTGPTPTLNQLLQSSNPAHRYQNSYGEFGMQKSGEQGSGNMPYNQSWPPQRPLGSYSPQQVAPGYRNQPPGGVPRGNQPPYLGGPGTGPGTPGPGSSFPQQQQQPGPQQQQQQQQQPQQQQQTPVPQSGSQQQQQHQYPPYPPRYPTPPGPGPGPAGRQPFAPHQLGSPYGQQQQQQLTGGVYADQRSSWAQNQQHSQQNQQQQQGPHSQQSSHPQPGPHPQQGPHSQQGSQQSSQQQQHAPNPQQSPSQPPQPQQSPLHQPQPSPQHQPQPSPQHQPQPSPQPHPQPSPQPQHPPPSPGQHPPPQQSPQQAPPPAQHSHQQQQQPPHPPQPHPQPPFPTRPQQPSTPNAHAPDTGDLTGQNSNDSSSGPAPGTPNSQGMRPTPSPTGSTGSRSMSPAVGQQNIPMPPRPSSGQSDGSGPTRMSHSPMATQSGYQQPLAPPSHMHPYKMGAHPGMVPPGGQQMPPYTPQGQQYPQAGNYTPRPQQLGNMQYGASQGYGPGPGGQQNPQANNMGPGQYPGRPMPNHVPQFPYQGWGGPTMNQGPPPNMMGGPGKGPGPQPSVPPQAANPTAGPRPHTPPHYLKQHLQHKMGFGTSGMPPSSSPLQVGYGSSSTLGPGSGPSPGMPPGSGPGMGPPGNMHHHSGMGTPMGPPPSGHHHPGMGPPPPSGPGMSMGPPGMGPPSSAGTSSGTSVPMVVTAPTTIPPTVTASTPSPLPNSHIHHDGPGPMPPPASTSNSHPTQHSMPGSSHATDMGGSAEPTHDNGITTTSTGTTTTNVTPATPGTVTSVVTTGPDGAPLDEGSQQSTLSNASAASGEDPSCTPKSRKDGSVVGGSYHSHPPTPQSTVPSPGAASLNSMHEEYGDVNSPSWPRTPASPVFNSHVHQDPYRSKKPDSLGKLYEMDESHERRIWLDKLLQFMEERGTPISACPTISKNPLDLFRLYLYVKERGGFMEVCKVTKNKTWKDIAGLLGIGASSSAAYTLRKHYTKNLLAFECHFDRGGIDPQPIINQVEASSKKKNTKATSVPSPGSSNSQDSFPAPGSSGTSMDGYGYGYPPGSTPDYNPQPMQRPASQTNAPSPHPGVGVPNQGAGDNISVSNPFDDVAPSQSQRPNSYGPPYGHSGGPPRPQGMQQGYQGQGGYSQYQDQYSRGTPGNMGQEFNQQYPPSSTYPSNRPMYPPYGPEGERYNQGGGSNQPSPNMQQGSGQDPYRYMGPSQPPGYPARTGYGGPPGPPSGPPNQQQSGPPTGYPGQQEYYRQDQMSQSVSFPTSQLARQLVAPHSPIKSSYQQVYPGQQPPAAAGPGSQMYPGSPPSKTMPPPAQHPRRHPDFTKEQQPYPPYQQRPALYGWSNSTSFRGPFPSQSPVPTGSQPWNQPPRPTGPPNSQQANNQWDQRYPSGAQPPYQPPQQPQQWVANMPSSGVGQSPPLRPVGPRAQFRPEGKPFPIPAPPGSKGQSPNVAGNAAAYPPQAPPKRELVFPPDSVEATVPVLYKRKRMSRADVAPVEAWRLMMSLRSGLLAESCWALDVLNILLFDDTTVAYFGLAHMPGLLDVLLEHFRRSLADMFDAPSTTDADRKWYQVPKPDRSDVDLGSVKEPIDSNDRMTLLEATPNYTLLSRKGDPVKVVNKDSDIFVLDSRKIWDVDGDVVEENVTAEVEQDQWQVAMTDSSSTKYIVTCFQGEFGNVPFVRLLQDKKATEPEQEAPEKEQVEEEVPTASPQAPEKEEPAVVKSVKIEEDRETSDTSSEKPNVISKEDSVNKECVVVAAGERKNCDKKKRTKTLIGVLSRIQKEPMEVNDVLTREIREKVEKNEVVKKEDSNEEKANNNDGETGKVLDDKDKKDKITLETTPEETMETNSNSLSLENSSNSNSSSGSETGKIRKEPDDNSKAQSPAEEKVTIRMENKDQDDQDSRYDNHLGLRIHDPAGTLKRRRMSDYEDECYTRDEASLYLVTETQDALARRCICLSNILRNLTFVPGNEVEFAKNATFLGLLGKLLLLHHEHPARTQKQRNYDREEDADFTDSCSSLQGEAEWWWDFLHHIRENVLVTAANIAGHMDLGQYPEEISRPVLDGLLHWAVCPAAHGQDPFPTVGPSSPLSPQRLALEALCKLCVTDNNVDLVIATPPYSRLERLCAVLTKLLCRSEEQVLREFAVNLLHYLAAADSGMARTVALQSPCVSLLVAFIEQAEASALGVANQHGISALRENPDSMGTSLDMLRRAAGTLLHLARHPDNRPLFLQQEQRLLALVMSQILDQQVASIISRVLFQCSRPHPEHVHFSPVHSTISS